MRSRSIPCLALVALAALAMLPACPAAAQPAPVRDRYRVLFVGNSLTYVNNLPAVLTALAASQPQPISIQTATYVAGGGSLAERWRDGDAPSALRRGGWDALVLQEQGALPECMVRADTRRDRRCRESIRAHHAFCQLAQAHGARVLLLETWNDTPATPAALHEGTRRLAQGCGADVVHAGDALQAYGRRYGVDTLFADPVHPRLPGTLLVAAQLHEALTGRPPEPTPIRIAFRLLPPEAPIDPRRPIEAQARLMDAREPVVLDVDAVRPFLAFAAGR